MGTKHTKPEKKQGQEMTFLFSFTELVGVVPLAQEDLWKLSSDKREVFFLFIAIYCLISTQTYCNQRVKIAGH